MSKTLAAMATMAILCSAPAAAQVQNPAGSPAPAEGTAVPAQPPAQAAPAPAARDPFAAIPPARPGDVKTMDAIVAALYEVISGDAGVERDWNRFRSLFYPGARMIPTGKNTKTGKVGARIASPEEYIKANESFLEKEGFHEVELSRHVDSYGTISHVFSAYEARNKLTDAKPFLRGINSIQLLNDGARWWVLTVAWSPETSDNPLPAKFTKKVER